MANSIGLYLDHITVDLNVDGNTQKISFRDKYADIAWETYSFYQPITSASIIRDRTLNFFRKGFETSILTDVDNQNPAYYFRGYASTGTALEPSVTYTDLISFNELQNDQFVFYKNLNIPEPTQDTHAVTKNYVDTNFLSDALLKNISITTSQISNYTTQTNSLIDSALNAKTWTTTDISDYTSQTNSLITSALNTKTWTSSQITDLSNTLSKTSLSVFAPPTANIGLGAYKFSTTAITFDSNDLVNQNYVATNFLKISNNLSDLNNVATARTNLGLSTAITSLTGTANQISVTSGTNPILSLPTSITLPGTISLLSTTTSASNFSFGDNDLITKKFVTDSISGFAQNSSITGYRLDQFAAPTSSVSMNGQKLTSVANGTANGDAVNYGQLTSAVSSIQSANTPGFSKRQVFAIQGASCNYATTTNLTATYSNGTNGVGATLTNSATTLTVLRIDGINTYGINLNDRILIKDQTVQSQNGIYIVTNIGSTTVKWVLTRATDYDSSSNINTNTLVNVEGFNINIGTVWSIIQSVSTIGTDPIIFTSSNIPLLTFFWNIPNGITAAKVTLIGGGASGAGTSGSGISAVGSSGGAGATTTAFVTGLVSGSVATVVIGLGGLSAQPSISEGTPWTYGSAGQNTTFTFTPTSGSSITLTANGGSPGVFSAPAATGGLGGQISANPISTNISSYFSIAGQQGGWGFGTGNGYWILGAGGNSTLGGGAPLQYVEDKYPCATDMNNIGINGTNAVANTGGGGGGSATGNIVGLGANGICIIEY